VSGVSPHFNPKLGFVLALITSVMWGAVPLAMTPLVADATPITISWIRMTTAGVVLFVIFAANGQLKRMPMPVGIERWLLLGAVLMLAANFVLYVSSLSFIAAPVAQSIVQIAPVLLMIGSLFVFGERFVRTQWIGFVVLLIGILVFCAERLKVKNAAFDVFSNGVLLMFIAAVCWAIYGIAQKRLLFRMRSQNVLMMIYLCCSVLMFPFTELTVVPTLDVLQTGLLTFLAANTLIGYGAFAEALHRWDASKVSAVLAFQPVVTLFGASLLGWLVPAHWPQEPFTVTAVLSALVVVMGSMMCALGANWGRT